MKKLFKNWGIPALIALCIAIPLNTFIISSSQVKASVLSEYQNNDRILINKITKNLKIGDIVEFKKNNSRFIRKIVNINKDSIIVSDKNNNQMVINQNDVIGKVVCKIF